MKNSNFDYQKFVQYMERYKKESSLKKSFVKVKNTNPYKYKRVFNKDKKQ